MVAIAIFGAGRIGRVHALNAAARPDVSVAYVVDPNEANARDIAKITGATIADEDSVFADQSIEGVMIATSTDSHAKLVQRAALSGKVMFCEKPLSVDFATANVCVDALNEHGKSCMVGFHRRYDPSIRAVHDRISDGRAGSVHQLVIFSRSGAVPSTEYIRASGGLFRDSSIHDLDMARYLLQEEMATVYAVGGCLSDERVAAAGDIDAAMITMVSRSGKLVQITNARYTPFGQDTRIEVLASNELLRVNNEPRDHLVVGTREGFRSSAVVNSFIERYAAAYRAEMAAFVQLITDGRAPLADHNDGLEAQRLAEAALRSFREQRPVSV